MRKIFLVILLILAAFGAFLWYGQGPGSSPRYVAMEAIVEFPGKGPLDITRPRELKVVTYNIGYASGLKNNKEAVTREEADKNLREIADALKEMKPDLVALQEVDFSSRRSFQVDQFRFLAEALDMPYGAYVVTWNKRYIPWPYWPPRLHFGRVLSGQAVLSRYPILSQESKILPKPEHNPFWYNWFYLDRVLQKLLIRLGDQEAAFWNVHIEAFHGPTRLAQAKILSEWVADDSHQLKWAAGDFNSVSVHRPGLSEKEIASFEDSGEALKAFAEKTGMEMDPANPEALSFPSVNPVKKLDQIFFSRSLKLLDSGNRPGVTGSDHLPVWGQFQLP